MPYRTLFAASLAVAASAAFAAPPDSKLPATPRHQIQFTNSTTRAFDRSGKYVTSDVRPDGSTAVSLNGSFQNVTVARIGPDGSIETYCTTSEADAKDWMARLGAHRDSVQLSTPEPGDAR